MLLFRGFKYFRKRCDMRIQVYSHNIIINERKLRKTCDQGEEMKKIWIVLPI